MGLVKKGSLMQPFLVGAPGGRGKSGDGKAKRISDGNWASAFPECKFNKLLEEGSVESSEKGSVESSEKPRCYARRADDDSGYVGLCDDCPELSWLAPTASQALEGIRFTVDQFLWEQSDGGVTSEAGGLPEGAEFNVDR